MTEIDGYRWFPIEDLPDVPLIRIFFFIDLEDLLLNVNRVCRRFYNLIKFTPTLWSIFEFYGPLVIKEEDLPYIFQHSNTVMTTQNSDEVPELIQVYSDQQLASIIENSDENCTIIIVNGDNPIEHDVVESNQGHVYADVQITNLPNISADQDQKVPTVVDQPDALYTAVPLHNATKQKTANDFDAIEQVETIQETEGQSNEDSTLPFKKWTLCIARLKKLLVLVRYIAQSAFLEC
ncbi:unnamed protein product [Mytilus edulis]|uniref:F-box domain-containing protein n=1 Tax=Mytilus edulis TaxID=6550 RepID=A0A8S3TM23_MYTED|nr:unnamed protein product [Mytilus edulis]